MQELSCHNIQLPSSIALQGSQILIEQRKFQVIGIENNTIGPVRRGTPPRSSPLPYSRTSTNGHFFLPPRWPLRRGSTTVVPSPSLPADVLQGSFVTHSFLPKGRPWGRNECVTSELERTSAGRLPKLTLRVCNVNLLSHEAAGVALQATVQNQYGK